MKQTIITFTLVLIISLESGWAAVKEMAWNTESYGPAILRITESGIRALKLQNGVELTLISDYNVGRYVITNVFYNPTNALRRKDVAKLIQELHSTDVLQKLEQLRPLNPKQSS